jgi:integrase
MWMMTVRVTVVTVVTATLIEIIGPLEGGPLPPIRFHDLRHGSATFGLLAKVDMKVISETLGHARSSFTADTYASVLPELAKAAAEAVAAMVPRRSDGHTRERKRPRRDRRGRT